MPQTIIITDKHDEMHQDWDAAYRAIADDIERQYKERLNFEAAWRNLTPDEIQTRRDAIQAENDKQAELLMGVDCNDWSRGQDATERRQSAEAWMGCAGWLVTGGVIVIVWYVVAALIGW